jgi:hypothetical protein
MSTWVLGGERIYDDDDEGSHVLDHSSLSMELETTIASQEVVSSSREDTMLLASGTVAF